MYDALTIANYVIMHCKDKGRPVSNLKLQKILYFIQAEFLVAKGKPCFDNRMEAWEYGPVVPDVYHEYKFFGSNAIFMCSGENNAIALEDTELIDAITDECNKYSASDLVDITHRQLPWIEAKNKYYNAEITNDSIKNFFMEK